jgi:hypothetical protein
MRALGDLLVILGLTIAAFAVGPGATDPGASPPDQVGSSRPVPAADALPAAPVSQTVYVPTRRTAAFTQSNGRPGIRTPL